MVFGVRFNQLASLQLVCLLAVVLAASNSFAAPPLNRYDPAKAIAAKFDDKFQEITAFASQMAKEVDNISSPDLKCRHFGSRVVNHAQQIQLVVDQDDKDALKFISNLINHRTNSYSTPPPGLIKLSSFIASCVKSLEGKPTGRVEELSRYYDEFARTH